MTRDELIDYLLTVAQIFAPAAAVALYALIIRMTGPTPDDIRQAALDMAAEWEDNE